MSGSAIAVALFVSSLFFFLSSLYPQLSSATETMLAGPGLASS